MNKIQTRRAGARFIGVNCTLIETKGYDSFVAVIKGHLSIYYPHLEKALSEMLDL